METQDVQVVGQAVNSATLVAPFHTSGNQILDANGNPVSFRGVNYTDLLSVPSSSSPAPIEHEFAEARAWGANLVRIALNEALWLPTSCTYNSGYEAQVDNVVNWVTSLGMLAVLNLEYNAPILCQQGGQQEMADNPGSYDFWQQVASRYGGNPLVAFDLYNEPHNISNAVWLDGGQATDGMLTYEAAGMQGLYNTVRATGTQDLVFVSGNNWSNSVPSTLVSGSNIVYSAHAYTCPTNPPPNCSTPNYYDPSSILDNWVGISASVPVVVGEFGWPDPNDATYNGNVIAFAHAHGWGWNALAWNRSSNDKFALVSQAPGTGTWQPTASGMPVLSALAGLS